MSYITEPAETTESTRRILSPDLARGFTLWLIALAHAPLLVAESQGDSTGGDLVVESLTTMFVDSRAFPLFATLLGYGLVLSTARIDEPRRARQKVRRRGRWLILFGLVMALVITPVEILGAYGVLTLILAGLVTAATKTVFRVVVILVPFAVVTALLLGVSSGMEAENQGFFNLGYDIRSMLTRPVIWVITVAANVLIYPTALAMACGILAARHRVLEDPVRHQVLLRTVFFGGVAVSVLGALPLVAVDSGWLGNGHLWWATAVHTLTGVVGGLGYLSGFALLGPKLERSAGVRRYAGALGRRSLSGYFLVEALLVIVLADTFLGLGEGAGAMLAAGVGTLAWLIAMALAMLLERLERPGPADALMRRLVRRGQPQRE